MVTKTDWTLTILLLKRHSTWKHSNEESSSVERCINRLWVSLRPLGSVLGRGIHLETWLRQAEWDSTSSKLALLTLYSCIAQKSFSMGFTIGMARGSELGKDDCTELEIDIAYVNKWWDTGIGKGQITRINGWRKEPWLPTDHKPDLISGLWLWVLDLKV